MCDLRSQEQRKAMVITNPITIIKEVWGYNMKKELNLIVEAIKNYHYISLDTEFPGFIIKPHRAASDTDRYEAMKINVDARKIIQVGLTLSDGHGNMPYFGGVWQFNFKDFDHRSDPHSPDSIELLKKNGINFEKNKKLGIDSKLFGKMLMGIGLIGNPHLSWITFHGAHDAGYLVKIVSGEPLPKTKEKFLALLSFYFGRFYDLKFMAGWCEGLEGGNLGLNRLAEILEVRRIGISHQAGSDSLVTSAAFWKMKERFEAEGLMCECCGGSYLEGCLYGMQKEEDDGVLAKQDYYCTCFSYGSVLDEAT